MRLKKLLSIIALFLSLIFVVSCTTVEPTPPKEEDEEENSLVDENGYYEVLEDHGFTKGFKLYGPDSRFHSAYPWAKWTFDKEKEIEPIWSFGTWGCFTNYFLEEDEECYEGAAIYHYPANPLNPKIEGDVETITNKTFSISLNHKTHSLTMNMDARQEYGVIPGYTDHTRISNPRVYGEAWPHMLVQQNMYTQYSLGDMSEIICTMDFTINKCDNYTPEWNPSVHSAQYQWFLVMSDQNPASRFYGQYIWFGITIYDFRYERNSRGAAFDGGKEDATSSLIYNIDSYDFINRPIQIGTNYKQSIDMKPCMEEALETAQNKGLFTDCTLDDFKFTHTNIGWELTGTFDVSVTINELSVKGKVK